MFKNRVLLMAVLVAVFACGADDARAEIVSTTMFARQPQGFGPVAGLVSVAATEESNIVLGENGAISVNTATPDQKGVAELGAVPYGGEKATEIAMMWVE